MSSLLKLPEYFLSNIFVEWLKLQCVSKMDCAVPGGTARANLQLVLFMHNRTFPSSQVVNLLCQASKRALYKQFIAWIINKGIMIDTIAVSNMLTDISDWKKVISRVRTLVCITESGNNGVLEWETFFNPAVLCCNQAETIVCCDNLRYDNYVCIADCIHDLRSITIGNLVSKETLEYLSNRLTKLTTLKIGKSYELHSARDTLFGNLGTQLESLSVTLTGGIGDADICRTILQCCPNLRSWKLIASAPVLAALVELPNSCPLLTQLMLTSSGIGDDSVEHIAAVGSVLTELSLDGCRRMSDVGLAASLPHCSRINTLSISACGKVGDLTAAAIAEHCPSLRSLELGEATALTDAGMHSLAAGRFRLLALDLHHLTISEQAVLAVLAHSSQLRTLRIIGSSIVSDAVLVQLPMLCPYLVHLTVGDPKNNLTLASFREVIRECRYVRHIGCMGPLREEVNQALRKAGKYRIQLDKVR